MSAGARRSSTCTASARRRRASRRRGCAIRGRAARDGATATLRARTRRPPALAIAGVAPGSSARPIAPRSRSSAARSAATTRRISPSASAPRGADQPGRPAVRRPAAPYAASQTNLYTGAAFEVTDAHFDELRALRVARITRPRALFPAASTPATRCSTTARPSRTTAAHGSTCGAAAITRSRTSRAQIPAILRFAGVEGVPGAARAAPTRGPPRGEAARSAVSGGVR